MKSATNGSCRRLLAILLCFLLVALPASAQSPANPQAGQVNAFVPAASRNAQPLKLKEEVDWRDVLKTDRSGRARLNLRDGSILSLGSNSELKVLQHEPNSQQTRLQLEFGRVRSRVVSLTKPDAHFEVRTPVATAKVLGTDFFVEYLPAGNTLRIICYSGSVLVTGAGAYAGQSVRVNAGQMVQFSSGNVAAPQATPNAVQLDSIAETTAEPSGTKSASGSHLLRNVLIGAAVAATGVVIGLVATRGESAAGASGTADKKSQ
jgi:hypothetical protein